MKFPSSLLQNGRKKKSSARIRNWNYVYTRHKPSSDWNHEEGLPDFTKIKLDQSFNWCNYSIPLWTRFNDAQEYLEEYAVAGFSAGTIRREHQKDDLFDTQVIDVHHEPIETNYSHCELQPVRKLSKTERRALRVSLRHNCIVPLLPSEKRVRLLILFDIVMMYFRRSVSGFIK